MAEELPEGPGTYTPYIEKAIREFTARQTQLNREQRRIQAALEALKAPSGRRPPRSSPGPSSKGASRPSTPLLRSGKALDERIISEVSLTPGVRVPELARRLEINTNRLHSIVSRLIHERSVRLDEVSLYPAGE